MGRVCELENFHDLTVYLKANPGEGKRIVAILMKLAGDKQNVPNIETQETFIRWLYHFDSEMTIPAEILRFIAASLYPLFLRNSLHLITERLEVAGVESDVDKIVSLLREVDTDFASEPESTQSPLDDELSIIEESLEQVEEKAPEEIVLPFAQYAYEAYAPLRDEDKSIEVPPQSIETTVIAQEDTLLRRIFCLLGKWIQYLRQYLQRRRYFLPEAEVFGKKAGWYIHLGYLWIARQAKRGYYWLAARHFFWPQIVAGIQWSCQQVEDRIRWFRETQEYYVRLRPYQREKAGYYVILGDKPFKVRLSWSYPAHLKKLYECEAKDTFRVLKGITALDKLSKDEQKTLTQLKETMVIREKVLTQPEASLDMINYGMKKFHRVLKYAGNLTNVPRLNKKIAAYFLHVVESHTEEAAKVFRQGIENCSSYPQLKCFMKRYPLYRLSVVEHYKTLQVILLVYNIIRDFEENPQNLTSILNRYLGACGEVNVRNHLVKVLIASHITERIWEVLEEERHLEGMLKKLERLKKSHCKGMADSLHKVLTTFLSGDGKFTFTDLQASINFMPEKIQKRITLVMRQKLEEDLLIRVNTVLMRHGNYLKRLQDLRLYFVDPRYHGASISIFGYHPQKLEEKISRLDSSYDSTSKLRHIFSHPQIPENFLELIEKAQRAQVAAQEKNVPNCLQILKKIENSIRQREQVHLHRVLVSLFKFHGEVNFAIQPSTCYGYQVADEINRFYQTPDRIELSLHDTILPDIKNLIKSMVENERKRQLQKMEAVNQ